MSIFRALLHAFRPAEPKTHTFISRMGKTIEADKVFYAWSSNDLGRMLRALEIKTNLIDRHFLLMGIVNEAYKQREQPEMAKLCANIADLHIREFSQIVPALKKDMGELPRVTTFQQFATLLTERGDYDMAIQACQTAIAFGLYDGTKAGFEGRIERIKKARDRATKEKCP